MGGYAGHQERWLLWEAARLFHGTLETQAWVYCQLFKEATMDGRELAWPEGDM